jgi:hypothetical protein
MRNKPFSAPVFPFRLSTFIRGEIVGDCLCSVRNYYTLKLNRDIILIGSNSLQDFGGIRVRLERTKREGIPIIDFQSQPSFRPSLSLRYYFQVEVKV